MNGSPRLHHRATRWLPVLSLLVMSLLVRVEAQPEFMPWGNLTGLRVEGELVPFETSLRAVRPDWSGYTQSSKYNWEGKQTYRHDAAGYEAAHALEGLPVAYTIASRELGEGQTELAVRVQVLSAVDLAGLYFCLSVPASAFAGAELEVVDSANAPRPLTSVTGALPLAGRGVRLRTARRKLECLAGASRSMLLRQDATTHPAYLNDPRPRQDFAVRDARGITPDFQFYFPLATGALAAGQVLEQRFVLRADATVDRDDVRLAVDATRPGRAFQGIGGNYRLQFPDKDPAVIAYCLEHLNVTWGRIAMYWRDWQPEENEDPVARANAGKLPPLMRGQLELAQMLSRRGIPIMVSVWDPPRWAARPWPAGGRGEELRADKLDASVRSVTSYLRYLKEHYGVEAATFSFNESDVGVEVREDAAQHAEHARRFGAAFAAAGLKTKMLLGDTGHGTAAASRLLDEVIKDPVARGYGAAVAFHTYHGCTPSDLAAWTAVSRALDLPLMVTEVGPDSAAHRYPQVFLEPWFALREADLCVRIAAACEPAMFMPWQLTSDYSVLTGGGLYGDTGPLRPTQRFWNLKQLGATAVGSRWLPVHNDGRDFNAAAWLTPAGQVGIHCTNQGATRTVVVRGLPAATRRLRVYCTDATRGMEELETVAVENGQARVPVPAGAFVSGVGEP